MTAARAIADLPGPSRLPLLGNAHQLARTSRLHLTAEGWARRYGPIIRVDIGRRRIVAISDANEIHRILRERPDGFRRWSEQEIVVREMGPGEMIPAGVFVAEGETWKRQRRLVITALNTNHLHWVGVPTECRLRPLRVAWPAPQERAATMSCLRSPTMTAPVHGRRTPHLSAQPFPNCPAL
jgi:cytochrome P450